MRDEVGVGDGGVNVEELLVHQGAGRGVTDRSSLHKHVHNQTAVAAVECVRVTASVCRCMDCHRVAILKLQAGRICSAHEPMYNIKRTYHWLEVKLCVVAFLADRDGDLRHHTVLGGHSLAGLVELVGIPRRRPSTDCCLCTPDTYIHTHPHTPTYIYVYTIAHHIFFVLCNLSGGICHDRPCSV